MERYYSQISLEERCEIYRLRADGISQNGISCRLDVQGPVPELFADERKVKQVLINLVGNAIKFNIEGGIVTVSLWANRDGFYIAVRDTGIGIAEEDIPVVLKRFGQVESARDRRYEGVGIGLPLSLALLRQHGGDLTIKSKPRKGTTITLRFPAERVIREETVS